jgi:predicted dehydrogenase
MTEKSSLRMAVVGAGKVSQNLHLPATQKSSACRLVAVCDASPQVAESVSARYSVPAMSFEDVLASDGVDAVLIAVGDPLHVDFAMMALDAGKHVLVEKPLGRSAEECSPLREKVRETGLILQVGTMKRHDPGIEYARQAVREQIGAVTSFSAWYIACGDDYVDEASVFLPVARDSSYARPSYKLDHQPYYLATHGAHIFDLIRFVVGPPVSVRAELGRRGDTYSWHGLVGLEDGAVGHFELTVYAESDWTEGFAVYGEDGSLRVDTPNPFFLRPSAVRVFDAASAGWSTPSFAEGDSYLRQLDAFAASVNTGKMSVGATVDDGIAALEIIEAVTESVAGGGTEVRIGPVATGRS